MSRPVLRWPDAASSKETWIPSADNYWWRPRVKWYPDTRALLPGDIVLFRPVAPTIKQVLIQTGQMAAEAREYTHAAIYLGVDHLIAEASGGGVVISSIEESVENYSLLVRRIPDALLDQQVPERPPLEVRQAIARAACDARGIGYDYLGLGKIAVDRLTSGPDADDPPPVYSARVICSALCERAVMGATRSRIWFRRRRTIPVTPEQLVTEPAKLEDVPLEWRRRP